MLCSVGLCIGVLPSLSEAQPFSADSLYRADCAVLLSQQRRGRPDLYQVLMREVSGSC